MLRKLRISLAFIVFVLMMLLFFDFTGTFHRFFGLLAKVQLMPAILAVNTVIIIALVLLTLLFGRIYCSVICPLGVLQDLISHFSKRGKKRPFNYSKPLTLLRWTIFAAFALLLVFAANYAALIEPYSVFGRIAANIFAPVYKAGNNVLAFFAEKTNSHAFYTTDVWLKSGITLGIAAVSLIVVGFMAWKYGRLYCNSICPVGTVLGLISRFSLFKPIINLEKCTTCGACARKCKSQCIHPKEHTIDYSRCVSCFNCLEACEQDAMKFKFSSNKAPENANRPENKDFSRRSFLSIATAFVAGSTLKAQEDAVDGGLAAIEKKKRPRRTTTLVPPGAQSLRNLNRHCTACGLCISACPNNILCPSNKIEMLMQPEMNYERSFCRPECTECSSVCPTRAIRKLTKEEKSSLQIGHSVWLRQNCLAVRDEINCEACEKHCPCGAISRVPLAADKPDSVKIPVVDTERCIGCGACEYYCPARPFAAIYVEGHENHKFI
ncbi:MAG: 4Fe-4S binding protein [Dysgonamonadaceae bacterium]|nr:4Fe-4S binding protein [Dysgonamonadaceae bacterium]